MYYNKQGNLTHLRGCSLCGYLASTHNKHQKYAEEKIAEKLKRWQRIKFIMYLHLNLNVTNVKQTNKTLYKYELQGNYGGRT